MMVTAVSKTKPSPSQFMPLVVCSLSLKFVTGLEFWLLTGVFFLNNNYFI